MIQKSMYIMNIIEGNFSHEYLYVCKEGLFLKLPVTNIDMKEDYITITVPCGEVEVNIKDIVKVRRPSNIIGSFTWCFKLNTEGDIFIGKKEV